MERGAASSQPIMALSDSTFKPSYCAQTLGFFTNLFLTSSTCALFGAISFSIGVLFDVKNTINMDPKGAAILQGAVGGALASPLALTASLIHYHQSIRRGVPSVDDTDVWMYHKRVFLSYRHLFYMLIAGWLAGGIGYTAIGRRAKILGAFEFGFAGGLVLTVVVISNTLVLRYCFRRYCSRYCPLCGRRTRTKWRHCCRDSTRYSCNCSSRNTRSRDSDSDWDWDCGRCNCSGWDCSGWDCSGCDCDCDCNCDCG